MTGTSARTLRRYPTAERPLKTIILEHKEEEKSNALPRAHNEAPSQPQHEKPADVCVFGHGETEQMCKNIESHNGAVRKWKWIQSAVR